LRVIEWRYGAQIEWRLVLVGLSETTERYEAAGYTPLRGSRSGASFRDRYGMPFAPGSKTGLAASTRACRAVIATRREFPGSEWAVFRALQFANFNTPLRFDDDDQMVQTISSVPGVDAERIISLIDDPDVLSEYEADKAQTRTAAGSPTELQGKAGNSDGAVRYTAPSILFTRVSDGLALEAGGFQPVEAYDVIVANLDPGLERRQPPEDVGELLEHFSFGLSTQEVAALLARGNDRPDRAAAESELLGLLHDGRAERHAFGDDAVWTQPGGPKPPQVTVAATATA
jgi:2-hydroxychromene-2-carboxylate isomerase